MLAPSWPLPDAMLTHFGAKNAKNVKNHKTRKNTVIYSDVSGSEVVGGGWASLETTFGCHRRPSGQHTGSWPAPGLSGLRPGAADPDVIGSPLGPEL